MLTSPIAPLKAPYSYERELNDDASERDLRRRSLVESVKRRKSDLLSGRRNSVLDSFSEKISNRRLTKLISSPAPVVQLPSTEEIGRRYEEWMRIAADNKINVNNTWDFALIDYFYDMSLLKDGDSVNFQKASCTLDGCMKIYTSRVDSVATETGKLLNGLAESTSKRSKDPIDSQHQVKTRRVKKPSQGENTLAKDFSSLTLKQFELMFSVDPLFKKTSADFDEGGARGLLLNHLSTYSNGKIIFDASDAAAFKCVDFRPETAVSELEITLLRNQFFSDFDSFLAREVCPSLQSFELESDISPDISVLKEVIEEFYENESEDFEDDHDGYSFRKFVNHEGEIPTVEQENWELFGNGVAPIVNNEENIYSYFDAAFLKSWAGPEHWKLSRVSKELSKPLEIAKRKTKKQAFQVDFINFSDVDEKSLFTSGDHPFLPKLSGKNATKTLLPDDMHFSSKKFLTLFTKPQITLMSRGYLSNSNREFEGVLFDDKNKTLQPGITQNTEVRSQADTQASSNLYNDADDEGLPLYYDKIGLGEQLVAQPKLIKTEYLNYAKTAKRVDVKNLKDNLWRGLVLSENNEAEPTEGWEEQEVNGTKRFMEVVINLKRFYSEKKLKDISVPFCFICLLHLANEKNLELLNNEASFDLTVRQIRREIE